MPRTRPMIPSRSRVQQFGLPLLAALTVALVVPVSAAAHVRWFTPDGPYWDPDWSLLFSWPVLLALVSAGGAAALLWLGERRVHDPLWPRPPFFQRLEPSAPAILGVQAAIALIYQATQLTLFVPNIELPENLLGVAIAGIAIVAGFSFITGVFARIGALLIIGLFGLAFAFGAWYEAIEQVIFVGIAVYLLAVGRGVVRYDTGYEEDRTHLSEALRPHALTILRVAAAISIIVLGFTEKLLAPELGMAFLDEYPNFNIPQLIGLDWFTDERFVYAVGIIEVTAGVALLTGKLIRVVILALWVPFNLGIAFLPPTELIGHLPILSTMYVLLTRGTEGIPPKTERDPEPEQRPAASQADIPPVRGQTASLIAQPRL